MKTVAVLVTYRPEIPLLERNVAALAPQVDGLVLVDDGSDAEVQAVLSALLARVAGPLPCRFRPQAENAGLAHAQNVGIAAARALGAGAVLLMDQDSCPAPGMVAALTAALRARASDRPAVVGTFYEEPRRRAGAALPAGSDVPQMEAVIASGSLIPLPAFDAVGPFDESLFIDFVDTEWCFRARAAGWRCFAARAARMEHSIGDAPLRLAGRYRAIHPPVRMYYQVRNLLLLARRPATPKRWLARALPRYLARSLTLSLAAPPRGARLRAIALGQWHGLIGRSGRWK